MTPNQAETKLRARSKRLMQFPQQSAPHVVGKAVLDSVKAIERYSKDLPRDQTKTAAARQLAQARFESKAYDHAMKTVSRQLDFTGKALVAMQDRIEAAKKPTGSQDAIILSLTANQLKGVDRKAAFNMAKENKDICRALLSNPILRHEFNIQGKSEQILEDALTGMVLNPDELERLSTLRLETQTLLDMDDALEALGRQASGAVERIESGQAKEPELPGAA